MKRIRTWMPAVLRWTIGLILIAASVDKILHPWEFAAAVSRYRVAGESLSIWIGLVFPWLECITGILLLAGVWKRCAATAAVLMMSVFFVMVTQAWIRGLDIHCGCFTVDGEANLDLMKLAENTLLLGGSMIMARMVFAESASRDEPAD